MKNEFNVLKILGISSFILLISTICYSAVINKVIVVVNDEFVTQKEFDKAFTPARIAFEKKYKGEELKNKLQEAREGILNQLIDLKLATSIAKKNNIKIDEKEIDKQVDKIRAYYGSEDVFLQSLSEKGTTLTEFKNEMRDRMLAQKLIEGEVTSKIVVTPSEIREVYEKNVDQFNSPRMYRVRQIMVRKRRGMDPKIAKKKIERVAGKLRNKKDFAELAKEMSEGPNAASGGDMGYHKEGSFLEEINEAVFTLKKGKNSKIVETPVGYHIFRVEEFQEPRRLELHEVSDAIKDQLYKKQFVERIKKWYEVKRKNAFISYK